MTPFAIAPALPLHKAGPFVAAAYIVFLAIVLAYVAIMARRLVRSQRELAELKRELLEREQSEGRATAGAPGGAAGTQPSGAAGTDTPERQMSRQL